MQNPFARFGWDEIYLVALLVLFGGLYSTTVGSHGAFMWDEAEYACIGRSVIQGNGFAINQGPNALRPPLLPLAGSAAMLLTGASTDITLKYAVVLFALLGLAILFHTVKIATDGETALLAVLLLGFAPAFWQHTSYFLSEIPFLTFFLGAVFYFHHGIYSDKKYFALSWGCWGLAVLTRYTAVLFGVLVPVICVLALIRKDTRAERWGRLTSRAFVLSPLIGGGFLLPWLIRQQVTFGDALVGFRAASQQLQVYMVNVSMPWSYYIAGLPEMVTWFGVIALMGGAVWVIYQRIALGLSACLVIGFLLIWFSCYRYKEPRLVTSILPFVAATGSIGIIGLWKTVLPKLSPRILLVAVLLCFGGATYRATRPWFDLYIALGYPILNQACAQIQKSSEPSEVVLASIGPQLAWYANRKTTDIPPDETQLKASLRSTDWVLFVNFERGQPVYINRILKYLRTSDLAKGDLFEYKDQQFAAYLCKSAFLLNRMETEPAPAVR
jgi:hypothetical protein